MKTFTKKLAVLCTVSFILATGCDDTDGESECERYARMHDNCDQGGFDGRLELALGACEWGYEEQGCDQAGQILTWDCEWWDILVDCSALETCAERGECLDEYINE
jgi:hypothetical protein